MTFRSLLVNPNARDRSLAMARHRKPLPSHRIPREALPLPSLSVNSKLRPSSPSSFGPISLPFISTICRTPLLTIDELRSATTAGTPSHSSNPVASPPRRHLSESCKCGYRSELVNPPPGLDYTPFSVVRFLYR
jgi:hypothetical protein